MRTENAYYEDGDCVCVTQQHFHQQKHPKQSHHQHQHEHQQHNHNHNHNTSRDQNQHREQLSAIMDTDAGIRNAAVREQRQQSPATATATATSLLAVEELFLGPVFESSQTVLAAIRALPTSVVHLDLDLRNTLHLIPQAMPLLFAEPNRHHLKHLSLRVFGDAGATEVAKWMAMNPNLEHLDLRENRIGSVGARSLVDAIVGTNSTSTSTSTTTRSGVSYNNSNRNDRLLQLSHLNLSYNCILDGNIIGRLLASNSTLTTLDLGYNWFADRDVQEMCQGLAQNTNNTSLRKLNLFGCHRITHVGMNAILHCLKDHNTSLQIVCLEAITEEEKRIEKQINYWLDLNKAGRCLIKSKSTSTSSSTTTSTTTSSGRERVPMGLWPLALEKSKMHPDSVFYLVREGLSPRIANYR